MNIYDTLPRPTMLFVRTSGFREKKQMKKQRDEDIRAKKETKGEMEKKRKKRENNRARLEL